MQYIQLEDCEAWWLSNPNFLLDYLCTIIQISDALHTICFSFKCTDLKRPLYQAFIPGNSPAAAKRTYTNTRTRFMIMHSCPGLASRFFQTKSGHKPKTYQFLYSKVLQWTGKPHGRLRLTLKHLGVNILRGACLCIGINQLSVITHFNARDSDPVIN